MYFVLLKSELIKRTERDTTQRRQWIEVLFNTKWIWVCLQNLFVSSSALKVYLHYPLMCCYLTRLKCKLLFQYNYVSSQTKPGSETLFPAQSHVKLFDRVRSHLSFQCVKTRAQLLRENGRRQPHEPRDSLVPSPATTALVQSFLMESGRRGRAAPRNPRKCADPLPLLKAHIHTLTVSPSCQRTQYKGVGLK